MTARLPSGVAAALAADAVRIAGALLQAVTLRPVRQAVVAAERLLERTERADVPDVLRSELRQRVESLATRARGGFTDDDERRAVANDAIALAKLLHERAEDVDFRVPAEVRDELDERELVWEVVRPMWFSLKTPYEPDARLELATAGQRALYALQWTVSEVENGGFDQYFWNSTGSLADEAVRGAPHLGATEYAEIVREACALFPGGAAVDRAERGEQLDAFSDEQAKALDELTTKFYDLLEREDPTELMVRYVRQHPDEFFLPEPTP